MMAGVPSWQFIERRRLVVTDSGDVLAAVLGSTADGVMLASARRLFDALEDLEARTGLVLAALRSADPVDPRLLDNLAEARLAAAQALILATEPTAH
jgi:hypothetical protein